jgi:hypothetical protein
MLRAASCLVIGLPDSGHRRAAGDRESSELVSFAAHAIARGVLADKI